MKSMKYIISICFIFLFAMAVSVFAELYQYRDENGVLTFTDDFSRIPVEQRSQLKMIKEVASEFEDTLHTTSPDILPDDDKSMSSEELMQEANELTRENERLNQEYASIIEEKGELVILREKLKLEKNVSESELADFKKQVSELNSRTKGYDARLKVHQDRTRAYNLKVEKIKKVAESTDGG